MLKQSAYRLLSKFGTVEARADGNNFRLRVGDYLIDCPVWHGRASEVYLMDGPEWDRGRHRFVKHFYSLAEPLCYALRHSVGAECSGRFLEVFRRAYGKGRSVKVWTEVELDGARLALPDETSRALASAALETGDVYPLFDYLHETGRV